MWRRWWRSWRGGSRGSSNGAGHLDNLILRAGGDAVTLASTGPPLGLLPSGLPYGEARERLQAGDSLVLYSDGVTDAQDASDSEYGEARLLQTPREAAGQPAGALIDRVFSGIDAFAGGAPQFDDITMVVVRRVPAAYGGF